MKVLKTAQRSIVTAMKLKFSNNKSSIIYLVILLLFSIFLSLGTNYSPTNNNMLNHDCGIFSYVGFAMQKGRILYTEIWENKGPLLYFIYYIGLLINERYGIYFLELLSIFISVLYGYKTIKFITNNKIYSLLGIIYTFSTWVVTFENGTLSESFALPLIFIGIYLFTVQILKNKKIKNIEIFIWGVLTALIATLRLNILATFLAFFIVIGINLLIKKEFKEFVRYLSFGALGFIITLIPIVIYLIKNNALLECMNTAYFGILDNFNPGTFSDKMQNLYNMIKTFNYYSGAAILMLCFVIVSMFLIGIKKIKRKEYILYILATILSIIINLYANSISGAYQMHYFIVFIPVLNIVISLLLKTYEKVNLNNNYKLIILTILIFVFSFNSYNVYTKLCNRRTKKVDSSSLNYIIKEYIEAHTNVDDEVQLIGGNSESVGANFLTRRLSASKYSYLPLWNSFTNEGKSIIINEFVIDLYESKPKLIIICKYNNSDNEFYNLIEDKNKWDDFLQKNYDEDNNAIPLYEVHTRK